MTSHINLLKKIKSDPYQYAAYEYSGNGIVKAGPGSGKTTVIIMKIKKILSESALYPRGLACITYSNATTNHFSKKLNDIGVHERKNVVLSTVHSFCLKEIILPFGDLGGSRVPSPLKIISDDKRKYILAFCLEKLNIKKTYLLTDFDILRNMFHSPLLNGKVSEQDKKIIIDYEQTLISNGYSDFSLIITDALSLISSNEYVSKCLEAKFPWILIDEYQDLGQSLHEMVIILSRKTNIKFFIVGDPDQSIYSFQGASPDYFYEIYDNPQFKQFELKRNYRTTQYLIDSTLKALNMDDREYESALTTENQSKISFIECEENMDSQYTYLANDLIPELLCEGIPPEEICVLLAKNKEVYDLGEIFQKNNIPYFIEGSYYMKLATASWIIRCVNYLIGKPNYYFQDIFSEWISLTRIYSKQEENYFELFKVLENSRKLIKDISMWFEFVNSELLFEELLSRTELMNEASDYERFKRSFLNQIISLEEFSEIISNTGKVSICTRHSSKGLEFGVIILLGLEEGNFPDFRVKMGTKEFREEQRVFFVSLTRAKYHCYLVRSKVISGIKKNTGTPYSIPKKPSIFWSSLRQVIENGN